MARAAPPQPTSQRTPWWRFEPLHRTGFRVGWSWLSTFVVAVLASVFIESPGSGAEASRQPLSLAPLLSWFPVVFLVCFVGGLVVSYVAWKSLRRNHIAASVGWGVGLIAAVFCLHHHAEAAAHARLQALQWAKRATEDQLSRTTTERNREHPLPSARVFTRSVPPPPAGFVLDPELWKDRSTGLRDRFGGSVIASGSAVISRPSLNSDTSPPVSLIVAMRGTIRKSEGGVLEGEIDEPSSWILSSLTIRWTIFDAQGNVVVTWLGVSRVFLRVPPEGNASVRFDVPPACNGLLTGERLTWSIEDAKGSVAR